MDFPRSDADSLCKFYGQPWKVNVDGELDWDPHYEAAYITRISAPYDMWMGNDKITKIACHKKIAISLQAVLSQVAKELNAHERKFFHLDQYGGCFNQRPIRGTVGRLTKNKVSLHAYGAAIDLAPHLNPLGAFYDPAKKMMPPEVIEIFKKNGWRWGGDFKQRPDCMHFEGTV